MKITDGSCIILLGEYYQHSKIIFFFNLSPIFVTNHHNDILYFSGLLACSVIISANPTGYDYQPPSNPWEDGCDCVTSFVYQPVCGSNGQTYPNYESLYCDNECYGLSKFTHFLSSFYKHQNCV